MIAVTARQNDATGSPPKALRYEPALDLTDGPIEKLQRFPREPDLLVSGMRMLSAMLIRSWLRVYHDFHVDGRENLPAHGSFVLAANHTSHLDALCLLSALKLDRLDHAYPAAAKDYFFADLRRLALAAIVVNALPFDRAQAAGKSIDLCRKLLEEPGNILVMFPEGTRSTTGNMGEFKRGIGRLLAGTGVPVVPCHLSGACEAWPKGRMLPRPSRIRLAIGTPRTYQALGSKKEAAEHVTTWLREAIVDLGPDAPLPPHARELHYD